MKPELGSKWTLESWPTLDGQIQHEDQELEVVVTYVGYTIRKDLSTEYHFADSNGAILVFGEDEFPLHWESVGPPNGSEGLQYEFNQLTE